MLSAFTNCFKIPELRQRIILTLGLIFIARVGAGIPLPGIDPAPLQLGQHRGQGGALHILDRRRIRGGAATGRQTYLFAGVRVVAVDQHRCGLLHRSSA